jgi:hypothetical protein
MLRHKPGVEALVVDAQGALHMTPGFRSHATMMESSLLANTTPNHEHL